VHELQGVDLIRWCNTCGWLVAAGNDESDGPDVQKVSFEAPSTLRKGNFIIKGNISRI